MLLKQLVLVDLAWLVLSIQGRLCEVDRLPILEIGERRRIPQGRACIVLHSRDGVRRVRALVPTYPVLVKLVKYHVILGQRGTLLQMAANLMIVPRHLPTSDLDHFRTGRALLQTSCCFLPLTYGSFVTLLGILTLIKLRNCLLFIVCLMTLLFSVVVFLLGVLVERLPSLRKHFTIGEANRWRNEMYAALILLYVLISAHFQYNDQFSYIILME